MPAPDGIRSTLAVCLVVAAIAACSVDEAPPAGARGLAATAPPCATAADCQDGNPCNGAEVCTRGRCGTGTALDCADAISCTFDVCDPSIQGCRHLADHGACPGGQLCSATGGCAAAAACSSNADCDDHVRCNGVESCVNGACVAGAPTACDDQVPCTIDLCTEAQGCSHVPDDLACGWGMRCTPTGCVEMPECASAEDCDDNVHCNGPESCQEGQCYVGARPMTADAAACTVDLCDEITGNAVHIADDSLCPAGQACDGADGCESPGASCTTAADCDDNHFCNGVETCEQGQCAAGARPSCDDQDPNTTDLCDEAAGCVHLCVPRCEGLECGLDRVCGLTCGSCAADEQCVEGQCHDCCAGIECGLDPACGGVSCGSCGAGDGCLDGQCVPGGDDLEECSASTPCTNPVSECVNDGQVDDLDPLDTVCAAVCDDSSDCADGTICWGTSPLRPEGADHCFPPICEPGSTDECFEAVGVCSAFVRTCLGDRWTTCRGTVGPTFTTELDEGRAGLCNGLDDNCDYQVDEGCCTDGEERSCGTDLGICAPGTQVCTGEFWGPCEGDVEPIGGSSEADSGLCNGLDDNCNGVVDDWCSCVQGSERPCGSDVGDCRMGIQFCDRDGWSECFDDVEPTDAIGCDERDANCNGTPDWDDQDCQCLDGTTASCGFDLGVCESGLRTCIGGIWGACAGATGPTTNEADESLAGLCNGLDDNCEGNVDEGCPTPGGDDVCVADYLPNAACAANDVEVVALRVLEVIDDCTDGTATVTLEMDVQSGADRNDIGLFLAVDGESALSGDGCWHGYLAPPLTVAPAYGDADGDGIPDLSGGPWWNGESFDPEDTCGDLEGQSEALVPVSYLLVACTDTNGNGVVDLDSCASWDRSTDDSDSCDAAEDAVPLSDTRCGCGRIDLEGLPL